jgi:hypothetical protein
MRHDAAVSVKRYRKGEERCPERSRMDFGDSARDAGGELRWM